MRRIPGENPSPWTGPEGNNTYLLPGAVPTLVDAGVGVAAHLDAVSRALGESRLARVLITHSHPDHVGGVPALLERWPEAGIRNSRRTAAATPRSSPPATGGWSRCTPPGTRRTISASSTKSHAISTAAISPGAGERSSSRQQGGQPCGIPRIAAPSPGPRASPASPRPRTGHRGRRRADRRIPEASRRARTTGARGAGVRSETVGSLVDRIYTGLHPSVVPAAADSVLAHLIKLARRGAGRRRGWALDGGP